MHQKEDLGKGKWQTNHRALTVVGRRRAAGSFDVLLFLLIDNGMYKFLRGLIVILNPFYWKKFYVIISFERLMK
ncbi:hypothetical protein KFK09_004858 [Dendrobium nobile]|uniref:Uncharacterized protein n=1 Tax=Dendrobium nobile TaxID=94219 RepID=A0A8T3BZ47_DENNO|nr:hypothetical protein KFK09_004858 [Dendrobium nobile]